MVESEGARGGALGRPLEDAVHRSALDLESGYRRDEERRGDRCRECAGFKLIVRLASPLRDREVSVGEVGDGEKDEM